MFLRVSVFTTVQLISYCATFSQTLCFRITKAQFQLQGWPLKDTEIDQRVKSCFNQCDLNLDGKITQEEFLKAGLSIAELFEFESDE